MTCSNCSEHIQNLKNEIDSLKSLFNKSTLFVSWEEKVTDSGIQLQGSSASQARRGTVIDTQFIPVAANQVELAYIIKRDDGEDVAVVSARACKILKIL